jgi:periplasmic protein TonB
MFDNITTPRAKTRRGTSMVVSFLLHGGAIALAIGLTYARKILPKEEPVTVVFHAQPPAPPPPPPPPAAHKPKTQPRQTPKTPVNPVRNLVQPKETPREDEKPPEVVDVTEDDDDGVEGGVEGGVVGGVVGGTIGGVVGGTGVAPPRVDLDDSEVRLVKLSGPDPAYTSQALEREVEGTMVVRCLVTIDGHVRECRVLKSLPFMDRAVIDALECRVYQPYAPKGQAVEVNYTFRIRLTLPN